MSNVGELVQAVRGSGLPTSGGSDRSSSAISFGARQAIIVRNNDSRKALPMPEFENATILTVAECKGATPLLLIVRFHTLLMCLPHLPSSSSHFSSLSPMTSGLEFDDVLLFNFFHDSLAKSDWRLFLNYLFSVLLPLQANREPGDDTILPTNGPIFGSEGHPLEPSQLQGGMDQFKLFESELKQLYVAVTRPRVRLWILTRVIAREPRVTGDEHRFLSSLSVRCCARHGALKCLPAVALRPSTSKRPRCCTSERRKSRVWSCTRPLLRGGRKAVGLRRKVCARYQALPTCYVTILEE